jgi:NDP-sugar pyrophosphorylase family protein
LIKVYDKEGRTPGMEYINYGVSVLRKEAVGLIPPDRPYTQEELYQLLIGQEQLLAFETHQRFYEIGSPHGLDEFRRLVAAGGLRP